MWYRFHRQPMKMTLSEMWITFTTQQQTLRMHSHHIYSDFQWNSKLQTLDKINHLLKSVMLETKKILYVLYICKCSILLYTSFCCLSLFQWSANRGTLSPSGVNSKFMRVMKWILPHNFFFPLFVFREKEWHSLIKSSPFFIFHVVFS